MARYRIQSAAAASAQTSQIVAGSALSVISTDIFEWREDSDVARRFLTGCGAELAGVALDETLKLTGSRALGALGGASVGSLTLHVTTEFGASMARYRRGEINRGQFLREAAEHGVSMILSARLAAMGELIGGRIVGAALGGAVGCLLAGFLCRICFGAKRSVFQIKQDDGRRQFPIAEYRDEETFVKTLPRRFFDIDQAEEQGKWDEFAAAAERFCRNFNESSRFASFAGFASFMESGETLRL